MTDDNIEITRQEYRETDEWEFRADIRCVLKNPDGDNVVAVKTYRARPKYDDLVHDESRTYEYVSYWWPESREQEGDAPFADTDIDYETTVDINDDEALMEDCLLAATGDPQQELESLRVNTNLEYITNRLG